MTDTMTTTDAAAVVTAMKITITTDAHLLVAQWTSMRKQGWIHDAG